MLPVRMSATAAAVGRLEATRKAEAPLRVAALDRPVQVRPLVDPADRAARSLCEIRQPLAQPRLHHFQVALHRLAFFADGQQGPVEQRQRGAQVAVHVVQHDLGARRVDADQRAQVGQRVEQHVRLELRLQQLELVLGGGALRAFGPGLAGRQPRPAPGHEGEAGRSGQAQRGGNGLVGRVAHGVRLVGIIRPAAGGSTGR